ncbi:DMT family transporter [Thalassotalea psychrophila]|uniref:DMT family transporter n=1 Tax=Thalassotalea psychrophila TaxID=3065647 RepID=A0ABY9TS21_9GAMM|nr:DMT family transporter [Colwelliaceae bacterium SQ149]
MKNLRYHFLSLLVTLLVAGSFLSSAKLSGVINPFSLTLLRFAIAALVLLPFVLLKNKNRKAISKALPRSLVMSLFFSIFFICMFEALKTTTALNIGTLYTLVPFMTAVFSLFVFKEKITKNMFFIYLLGIAGTCLVIFRGDLNALFAFSLNSGDALFLLGCVSMVCFSISMKLLYRGDKMIVVVFCTLLGGAFWMLLALFVFEQPLQWHLLNKNLLSHMAYLALFATLASTFIIQKTTVILGPARVMAYIYLSPVFVALLTMLIEEKTLPNATYAGMFLSIAATIILQLHNREVKSSPKPISIIALKSKKTL